MVRTSFVFGFATESGMLSPYLLAMTSDGFTVRMGIEWSEYLRARGGFSPAPGYAPNKPDTAFYATLCADALAMAYGTVA